jgi:mono/diheme cytochrome c family protein
MQVKIVIGTLAFMLTMIIFGYAALREPARLERWAAASIAHEIEKGGDLYHSNCASCHGEDGDAAVCYDAAGEQVACSGRVLAHAPLLCPDPITSKSQRMTEMAWEGTLDGFISSTLAAGRPQNGMPTWGAQFGGSLEKYQIDYITKYVINWRTVEMCSEPTPEPVPWPASVAELPTGNPTAGEQAYNLTYGCAACHGQLDAPGSNAVGPWVGEFAVVGPDRIAGYTSADYLYESILLPWAYTAPECPAGACAPQGMPNNFGTRLSLQDMADIIAYSLGTTDFESNVEIDVP